MSATVRKVTSVHKALRVLGEVAENEGGLGIAELARRLALNKSGIFRLAHALEEEGFLERTGDGRRFQIGRRAFAVGSRYPRQYHLLGTAVDQLRRLVPEHTSYVGILDGTEVLVLASNEGAGPIRASPYLGRRRPLHSTALGKAILASLPESRVDEILGTITLPAITPATITSPELLRTQISEIRERGYSEVHEEARAGVESIGVSLRLFATSMYANAGISVSFPSNTLTAEERLSLVHRLLEVARRVEELVNVEHDGTREAKANG